MNTSRLNAIINKTLLAVVVCAALYKAIEIYFPQLLV